jgi:Carboxypeptidase regulatory-like domain/TonB dependent receptor
MFNFKTTCPGRIRGSANPIRRREQSDSHTALGQIRLLAPAVLLVMMIPTVSRAQVLYGALNGTVTDQKDAAVPGARVEITNIKTAELKAAVTDDRGSYAFSNLQVGEYKMTIALTSFKTKVLEDIHVEANKVFRYDARLEVGELKETVVVTSDANPPLQTDRTDVNITQTTRQINDLPLTGSLGRNYQSMMMLVPGAVSAGEQNSAAGNPQRSISFNVNGVSRLQNNTRIDGAGVVYPWLPTNTVYVPPAESIQAVNIVTNSFDAEQGLAGGAAINLTIKSGTNGLHGVGWGYDTNSATQARNFFQTTPQVPKSILAQFGYAVSGPIVKNKLFFFTDLERTTQRNLARPATFSVAPSSLRPDANGNVNFTSTGIIIYDPLSNPNPALRTPFANDTIPANRIDIAALELMKRLPLPTGPGFVNNFNPNGVATFDRTNVDAKVNYNVNSKMTLFGRYSISPTTIFEPPIFGEASGPALNGGQLGAAPSKIQVAGFGGTYTFGPHLILDANVGYTRQKLGAQGPDVVNDGQFGVEVLKIPGTNGPDPLQAGIPSFQIGGWTNIGNDNTGNPFLFRDNQYLAAGNVTWLKGAHDFRFGVDYQNQQLNHFQPQGGTFQTVRGTFTFDGASTRRQGDLAPADSRYNSWADFLLGLPRTAGKVDQLRNPNSIYMQSYALYARDHWQINRSVTLSYGLRWERYPFPTKDNTGINRFDPADGNIYTGGLSGVPHDTGAASGPGNFMPRIGLAWRLNDRTVVRGGYGQSLDPRPFIDFRNAYPIVNAWAMPAISFNGATNGFIPVTTLRQGLINTGPVPDLTAGILKLPANSGTTTYPKTPMRKIIHSWNVIMERELPWKFVGQIGYVGTRANGQMGFININAGAPGTGTAGRPLFQQFGLTADINEIIPYGDTTYDAMQASLVRRYASSIIGTVFTWSKAINFADNDGNPRIQYLPEKQHNRGLAGYDRTFNSETYWVYDIPVGKNHHYFNHEILSKIFGDWQVNGTMSIQSGTPINVTQDTAANLLAGGSSQYPNLVKATVAINNNFIGGLPVAGMDPSLFRYFDTTAYASENGAKFGSGGRDQIRGPGYFNIDAGLYRTIKFNERFNLQFRAEALNALNHPNFSNPGSNLSSGGAFGYITSTTGQGSRIFRFGARFQF